MPPFPPVPNVIKVETFWKKEDANGANINYFSWSGGSPSSGILESWLSGIWAPALDIVWAAEASTAAQLTGYQATDLTSATGAQGTATDTTAGTRTGDFAPASSAVLVSLQVPRRWRGGHPRNYWPFGTAGTYLAGSSKFWDTSFIADVQSKMATWLSSINGHDIGGTEFSNLVNVSFYDKALNPTPPYRRAVPLVDTVTDVLARERVCSQRRRLGKLMG